MDATYPTDHLTEDFLREKTGLFLGEVLQKPPLYSAIKKEGRRLYEYARKGESVEIPSRKVTIRDFELTRIDLPEADFRVVCSKGTYIRSLADDFGRAAGSGAYLSALKRTKIGPYNVNKAMSPSAFRELLRQAGMDV